MNAQQISAVKLNYRGKKERGQASLLEGSNGIDNDDKRVTDERDCNAKTRMTFGRTALYNGNRRSDH